MNTMIFSNYTKAAFILITLLIFSSCKKNESNDLKEVGITITEYGNTENINLDTIYLATDYHFFGKALIESPSLTRVRYVVLYDGNEMTSTSYTPEPGGTGFLVDSITFDINYSNFAASINHVTLQVEATRGDGQVTTGHTTFKLQPINYPFLFRFYDFNSSDTLPAGSSLTIRPFYSPLIADDQISTMKVYLKAGFGAESLVNTFGSGDFFFYQTGYLREYDYQVPALPPGSGVVHRFELVTTKGRTHVIQHTIRIQ
ncbi:MAG: hypothetical protein ACOYNC_07985 [Bacteroidales bacterium]